MDGLLEVRGLSREFGGIRAVDDLSFSVAPGSITGIIGPNGAGKTTVFNLVTGVYRPTAGEIRLGNTVLSGRRPDEVVRAGVARTFQNIRLFNRLSCLDNVRVPLLQRETYGVFSSLLRLPRVRARHRAVDARAEELLDLVGLREHRDRVASNLPYGLQRKLEIARALAMEPRLLLLDEPAAGMNGEESRQLSGLVRELHRRFDLTILLIEHHMDVVMGLCDRILVLHFGACLAWGTPEEVRSNEQVLGAYLGKEGRPCSPCGA